MSVVDGALHVTCPAHHHISTVNEESFVALCQLLTDVSSWERLQHKSGRIFDKMFAVYRNNVLTSYK